MNGRPVDIEIVPRAHAILSASSAERWLVCTPSARIEEALPDQPSPYASDGTAAHAFAETRLRWLLKEITKAEYVAAYEATKKLYADAVEEWETSDWDAIDSYVEYVLSEAKRLDATVTIEARVDYSKFAQEGFGTSDALLVSKSQRVIKSIDLKFGKGVPVSAFEDPQAKLYALGGVLNFDPHHEIENVEWAIVQPRLDYVGEGGSPVKELLDWAENVVAPAAEKAWEGKGELVPTDKGCRFCKAAATCRARAAQNVLIARRDFAPMPDIKLEDHLMDMDEVARILPQIDGWLQWANALKAYALEATRDRGEKIEGYKLVRGRAARSWNPNKDVPAELKRAGVSETDIYAPAPVRSVAQLEKVLGKKPFEAVTSSNDLVTKPLGTPALVADTDPRPAIDRAAEAAAGFATEE